MAQVEQSIHEFLVNQLDFLDFLEKFIKLIKALKNKSF